MIGQMLFAKCSDLQVEFDDQRAIESLMDNVNE